MCNWCSLCDWCDEIDLVCCDGEMLVFVEVKMCVVGVLVGGYFVVDVCKKCVLWCVVGVYLCGLCDVWLDMVWFDIVEV